MRRLKAGSYITHDGRYRVERGWADEPGTDRRRQTWIVTRISANGDADIIEEARTLATAKQVIQQQTDSVLSP